MSEFINIIIPAEEVNNDAFVKNQIAIALGEPDNDMLFYRIVKKSLDARKRDLKYNLRIEFSKEEDFVEEDYTLKVKDISTNNPVHIIGAGPAGYFAALEAIELGLKPIIFERGKKVQERRRDLKKIHQDHIVNANSNYCFGEGGAGTYSDGKLYTRSKKRGNTLKVLEWLVGFGATPEILVNAHPHIGTNKLPKIIEAIREYIIECGGEINFESCLTDFNIHNGKISSLIMNGKTEVKVDQVILATGHSARDIFQLLYDKNISIEAKNFALGIRIEHSQELIDKIQYYGKESCDYLPPASYSLVTQAKDRGVFSFCMCPGGIIAPCATAQEEVVTNGWSPSKRNNPFANSGIVVEVTLDDVEDSGPLALLNFQKKVEYNCWVAGGKTQRVPAQRMIDFIEGRVSKTLPDTSYQPGVVSADLNMILPDFITQNLKIALKEFGKKMKGYLSNDAVLHAPESRTSSPIRVPRDSMDLNHPEIANLYPCAEGAGYAGGIVSAAVDGMRCMQAIAKIEA